MPSNPLDAGGIRKTRRQFAVIWFDKLRQFHGKRSQDWRFSADDVIAYLRHRKAAGMPARMRLKIVEGLICYRRQFQNAPADDLVGIRHTLQEFIMREQSDEDIDDLAGHIDPNEPEPIQEMRRRLRLQQKSYATEQAYVPWVRRFMMENGWQDFESLQAAGSNDVEEFLSRLAVERNVAESTQDQAFYALL